MLSSLIQTAQAFARPEPPICCNCKFCRRISLYWHATMWISDFLSISLHHQSLSLAPIQDSTSWWDGQHRIWIGRCWYHTSFGALLRLRWGHSICISQSVGFPTWAYVTIMNGYIPSHTMSYYMVPSLFPFLGVTPFVLVDGSNDIWIWMYIDLLHPICNCFHVHSVFSYLLFVEYVLFCKALYLICHLVLETSIISSENLSKAC